MGLVVLVLSLQCYAADDAPVLLQAGDPAPVAGVLLPDALAVRRARELAACNVELPKLREGLKASPTPLVVVLVAVGSALVGAAVAVGVVKATSKP